MTVTSYPSKAIAIVGLAGRFPQAPTVERLWEQLVAGVECLTRFTDEELADAGVPMDLRRDPRYVPVRGVIDGRDLFDAGFFGMNPRESELTDPQHRLLLECAWEAMENAGYDPGRPSGPVGVFAGVAMNTYLIERILQAPALRHPAAAYQAFIGNDKDFCATRVSYKLGLRGPGVNVQTGCSTSLVAVHLAGQSLLAGECDMAIAGAAAVEATRAHGHLHEEGMILSPDGHCRPFDAAATGTVIGEGVACVVLKRLADAIADGDAIRAVILGSSINNDGAAKAGYTAPSIEGQYEAIARAQDHAGVPVETIRFVEGHGTATPIGDPIEVSALTRAFRRQTSARGFAALGSIKSNIGHTDTVAGMAGLIKAVLALEHRLIPGTVHFDRPNPALDLETSPFFVNRETMAWPGSGPARAAVSSFGIGGTNAHAILEEAPREERPAPASRPHLLVLSARSRPELEQVTTRLADQLAHCPDVPLDDVEFTLQQGRRPFDFRRTIVCRSTAEAVEVARSGDPRSLLDGRADGGAGVAFMFTGQGAQYPGMGAGLYRSERVFRKAIDGFARVLDPLGIDLLGWIVRADRTDREASRGLAQTSVAQPVLFALEHALAQVWMARGVEPAAMVGHSVGEYVAATLAGVMDADAALGLVAARGRVMQAAAPGAMLAVGLPEAEVLALIPSSVSVAAVNGPALVVVSGPADAIASIATALDGRGVSTRQLHTSHAFHSSMMDPVLEAFRQTLRTVRFRPPTRRYVSNLTGTWITADEVSDPEYWVRHLRSTVRFADGLAAVAGSAAFLLEVGPGRALASFARTQARDAVVVTSLPHPDESMTDEEALVRATGDLWRRGAPIVWADVSATDRRRPRRVALPSYPFQRQSYWLDAQHSAGVPRTGDQGADEWDGKRSDVASWFYVPSWTRTPWPRRQEDPASGSGEVCLVMAGASRAAAAVVDSMAGQFRIIRVGAGTGFREHGDDFEVDPGRLEDFALLFSRLRERQQSPTKVLHLLGMDNAEPLGLSTVPLAEARAYHSLVGLAQGLGDLSTAGRRIVVAASGVFGVLEGDRIAPEKALAAGPARTAALDCPGLSAVLVDVGDLSGAVSLRALADRLVAEMAADGGEPVVAYRGKARWVRRFEPDPVPASATQGLALPPGGTFVLTGGYGSIALELGDWLAQATRGSIVLVGRTPLPARHEWADYIASHGEDDRTRVAIERVQLIESRGATALLYAADVTDPGAMTAIVDDVLARTGRIDGVVHAAGAAGGGLIPLRRDGDSRAALAPKVAGTLVLHGAMAKAAPAWIVLCSSRNADLAATGAVDYCAANAFLDAFAEAHDDPSGARVLSIGWDTWRQTGMATRLGAAGTGQGSHLDHGMTNDEGREVLRRSLAVPAPHRLVLTQGYDEARRRAETTRRAAVDADETSDAAAQPLHARPALDSDYVAPEGEVETALVAMWERLLGVSHIGRHDSFFALGGHSLLATQLLSRIRDRFAVQVPLRVLFDASTVAEQARHIAGLQWVMAGPAGGDSGPREEIEL